MEHYNLNDNQITLEAGIANGIIGKARKRGSLSLKNIAKVVNRYSNLNPRWLLTGEGEMLLEQATPKSEGAISIYKEILAEKDKKIEELSREIGRLQAKIDTLNGKES